MTDLPISAGTVDVTNASTSLSGTSTSWLLDRVKAGDSIRIYPASGQPADYTIAANAAAEDALTLTQAWAGSTDTGLSYEIFRRNGAEVAVTNAAHNAELVRKVRAGLFQKMNAGGVYADRSNFDDVDPADYDGVFIYVATTDAAGNALVGYHNVYMKLSASDGDWSTPARTGGADGMATTYAGSGTPSSGLGSNGETYLDYATGDVYAKAGGSWAVQFSLIGPFVGVKSTFATSTTMEDPTAGYIRFNNADPSSATLIALSEHDARSGNPDNSGYINTWDDSDSTIKGRLVVRSIPNQEKFASFKITAVTDNSDWFQLAVTPAGKAGTLSADEPVALQFVPTGDAGTTGADGIAPGFTMTYSDSTTDEDPGAGYFRADDGTFASITELYVDAADANGNDILSHLDDLLDAQVNSIVQGILFIYVKDDSFDKYMSFNVLGITSATGYRKLAVDPIATSGTFADDDECFFMLIPVAAPGDMPGPRYTVDLSSQSDSDPGSGVIAFNNADPTAATELYIDDLDALGIDVSTFLSGLGEANAGAKRERIRVQKRGAAGVYVDYWAALAAVDRSGYWRVTVSVITSGGSLVTGDSVTISAARSGEDGASHGYRYTLDLASTADSDPANGDVRVNNADLTAVTEIYMDNLSADARDVSPWQDTFDDSTNPDNRGSLKLTKRGDPSTYVEYQVNDAVVDATGYRRIPVTYVIDAGTLADNDEVIATFMPTGDSAYPTGTKETLVSGDDFIIYDSEDGDAVKRGSVEALFNGLWDTISGGNSKTALVDDDQFTVLDSEDDDAAAQTTLANLWTWVEGKFADLTEKTTPIAADSLPLVDSAASDAGKRTTITNLALALWKLIASATGKGAPVDADMLIISDSAASNAGKKVTFTQAWTNYFKGKADALYSALGHNHDATYMPLSGGEFTGGVNFGDTIPVRFEDGGSVMRNTLLSNSGALEFGNGNFSTQTLYGSWGFDKGIVGSTGFGGEDNPDSTIEVNGTGRFTTSMTVAASGLTPGANNTTAANEGWIFSAGSMVVVSSQASTFIVNRIELGAPSNFMQWRVGGSTIGNISHDGAGTVTYGTFMGVHPSEMAVPSEIKKLRDSKGRVFRGTVVEATPEFNEIGYAQSKRHPKFRICKTAGSKRKYGTISNEWWDDFDDSGEKVFVGFQIAAVGLIPVRMAADQVPEIGDAVEPAGNGVARIQSDDIKRPSTIGFIRTGLSETYEDGTKLYFAEA